MKKIWKLFAVMLFLFMGINTTRAATLSVEKTGYYFERGNGDGSIHSSYYLKNFFIDNKDAYCIEPGTPEGDSSTNYVLGSINNTTYNAGTMKKVALIAYFGYNYPGHNTQKYRSATQGLIWKEYFGENSWYKFSTEKNGAGEIFDVSAEDQEITSLVNSYYTVPNIGSNIKGIVGETITLEDINKVLKYYDISFDGGTYSVNGNKLSLTLSSAGSYTLSFNKKKIYKEPYKIYYADGYQDIVVPGEVENVSKSVNVNIGYGSLIVTKKDRETSTPQGNASLYAATYYLYDKDMHMVKAVMTDKNGIIKMDKLSYGIYKLVEAHASVGYTLNDEVHTISIVNENPVYIDVYEDVIKNEVKVHKTIKLNNEYIGESNIIFNIYLNDKLYKSITTNSDGDASVILPFGEYTFKQQNTTPGFAKTEDFKVNVIKKNEVKNINIEDKRLGIYLKVNLVDTNGRVERENIKFRIKDIDNDIYLEGEYSTNNKGIIYVDKIIPNGKYELIQETRVSGYLLYTEPLKFEVNEDTVTILENDKDYLELYFYIQKIHGGIYVDSESEMVSFIGNDIQYSLTSSSINFKVYSQEKLIFEGETDFDNKVLIDDLELGEYVLYWYSQDGYELGKYDVLLNEKEGLEPKVYEYVHIIDYLDKGIVNLIKKNNENEFLEGVTFNLFDQDNNILLVKDTNAEGVINIVLPVDNYYFQEYKTLNGYELNDEEISFEITKDNVTNLSVINNLIVEDEEIIEDELPAEPEVIDEPIISQKEIIEEPKIPIEPTPVEEIIPSAEPVQETAETTALEPPIEPEDIIEPIVQKESGDIVIDNVPNTYISDYFKRIFILTSALILLVIYYEKYKTN